MIALDTSVAVPLLVGTHSAHPAVVRWWDGRDVVLSGHALAETYSVLTRLPGDIRVAPADAARLLADRFGPPLVLDLDAAMTLPETFARLGIAGGAVYDALVALPAAQRGATLATRDARARATYDTVGVTTIVAG
ncbi:MAG: type II toxin-antitoxin system VapC family toxin [Baekduiaceae bacterium]